MMGTIGILNVGAGDTKLTFDPSNPQDMIRAARIVKDMLRRGYALLVDTGQKDGQGRPVLTRAKDFDEATCEYIIADFDPTAGADPDEPSTVEQAAAPRATEGVKEKPKPRGRATKRLPASTTRATAVSRSAGG